MSPDALVRSVSKFAVVTVVVLIACEQMAPASVQNMHKMASKTNRAKPIGMRGQCTYLKTFKTLEMSLELRGFLQPDSFSKDLLLCRHFFSARSSEVISFSEPLLPIPGVHQNYDL